MQKQLSTICLSFCLQKTFACPPRRGTFSLFKSTIDSRLILKIKNLIRSLLPMNQVLHKEKLPRGAQSSQRNKNYKLLLNSQSFVLILIRENPGNPGIWFKLQQLGGACCIKKKLPRGALSSQRNKKYKLLLNSQSFILIIIRENPWNSWIWSKVEKDFNSPSTTIKTLFLAV